MEEKKFIYRLQNLLEEMFQFVNLQKPLERMLSIFVLDFKKVYYILDLH